MSLIISYQLLAKDYTYHFCTEKQNTIFLNLELDLMEGNGIMVCVDGGGSVASEYMII
jgi:hypothetical protein